MILGLSSWQSQLTSTGLGDGLAITHPAHAEKSSSVPSIQFTQDCNYSSRGSGAFYTWRDMHVQKLKQILKNG